MRCLYAGEDMRVDFRSVVVAIVTDDLVGDVEDDFMLITRRY